MKSSTSAFATFLCLICAGMAPFCVQAQTIYRCVGADGKTAFSQVPCTTGQRQEATGQTAAAQGTPGPAPAGVSRAADVKGLCKQRAGKLNAGQEVICRDIDMCEKTGNPLRCEVWCADFLDAMDPFPGTGIELGPISPTCLAVTRRARGSNWYEASGRVPQDATPESHDYIRLKCLNKRGRPSGDRFEVVCKSPQRCTLPATSGKALDAPYEPLEAVASRSCRASLKD